MKKEWFASALVILVLLAVSQVYADPIHVGDTLYLTYNSEPFGGVDVDRHFDDGTHTGSLSTTAGLILMDVLGGGNIETFCVQMGVYLAGTSAGPQRYDAVQAVGYTNNAGSAFQFAPGELVQNEVDALGKLWANALGAVHSGGAVEAAAFQLAVWELVYDDATNGYNLANGLFSVTGPTSTPPDSPTPFEQAVSLANSWLTDALPGGGWSDTQAVLILQSENHQDLIAPTSVPEPATMLLLGLGIAGVGLVRRRFQA